MDFDKTIDIAALISILVNILLTFHSARLRKKLEAEKRKSDWRKRVPEIIKKAHIEIWRWSNKILELSPRVLVEEMRERGDELQEATLGKIQLDVNEWKSIWDSEEFQFEYEYIDPSALKNIREQAGDVRKKVERYQDDYSFKPLGSWREKDFIRADDKLREISRGVAQLGLLFSIGF
jgi:hypothetical protein